jgi:hypothetical protein
VRVEIGPQAEHRCCLYILCTNKHSMEACLLQIGVVPGLNLSEETDCLL